MPDIERTLTLFFERVASRDACELDRLGVEPTFTLHPDRWQFTLPDLFAYLQGREEAFRDIDYRRFRQILFNSPVNQAVRRFGAEIAIADNRGKVDQSTYALLWRADDTIT